MRELARKIGFDVVRIDTRRVKICQKEKGSKLRYNFSKIITELLSLPAKLLNKGHDALFFLRKP